MGIFDSEKLGRRVRQVWEDWAKQQPDILDRPDWLDPWDKLPPRIQEVDKRIGTAIAGDVFVELQGEHAAYQLRIAALEAALRESEERNATLKSENRSLQRSIDAVAMNHECDGYPSCQKRAGCYKPTLTPEGGGK